MPLVDGSRERIHERIFAETTYHAAYQPHRAVRSERWKYIRRFDEYPHPILANCDEGPSKDLLIERGWAEQRVPVEALYELDFDPNEACDRSGEESARPVLEEMRAELDQWMRETGDPLLDGPVAPPPGTLVNDQSQRSPDDPLREARPGAPSAGSSS